MSRTYMKPKQYQIGIDTFDLMRENATPEERVSFAKWNIMKYAMRKKGQDISDFEKIVDYAKFGLESLLEIRDRKHDGT